jgi:hypothetical protein
MKDDGDECVEERLHVGPAKDHSKVSEQKVNRVPIVRTISHVTERTAPRTKE